MKFLRIDVQASITNGGHGPGKMIWDIAKLVGEPVIVGFTWGQDIVPVPDTDVDGVSAILDDAKMIYELTAFTELRRQDQLSVEAQYL